MIQLLNFPTVTFTYRLEIKLEDLKHVSGNVCKEGVQPPVGGKVTHNDGPDGWGPQHLQPGGGWWLLMLLGDLT